VLANFIARVTIPGVTTETTNGTFVAFCSNPNFNEPACVKNFGFDSPLKCTTDGILATCPTGTAIGCCKAGDGCLTASGSGVSPVCVLSGPATVTTVTTASVTVPGFFAESCMESVAPGGCRACFHCCIQAYGKDKDAVTQCKTSFCNTQRIVTRCALLRATLRVRYCAAAFRGVPCLTLRHPTDVFRAARKCARPLAQTS
jgi:hypothetical protein